MKIKEEPIHKRSPESEVQEWVLSSYNVTGLSVRYPMIILNRQNYSELSFNSSHTDGCAY